VLCTFSFASQKDKFIYVLWCIVYIMKKEVIIGIGILIIILIAGYFLFFTNLFKSCPSSCDDFNDCTEDYCSEETNFDCVHKPIDNCCGNAKCEIGENYQNCADDCPNCDDSNYCTEDSYDYHLKECVNKPIIPCCGNGICEDSESKTTCSEDCIFGNSEYIELGVSYLNNPSHFTDTGQRYFYSIENCLSDNIETLEIISYYNGEKEGETITKSWLQNWGSGSSEYRFVDISSSTCEDRVTLIPASSENKELGTKHNVKVYYKFEYKGKTFEFNSDEKEIIVLDREPMKGVEEFAIFTLDSSNIKKVD